MLTDMQTLESDFLNQFESTLESFKENEAQKKLRLKAWQRFCEMGLPSTHEEVFQYVRMKALYMRKLHKAASSEITPEKISQFVLPESKNSYLVFVNGYFRPDLSDKTALPASVIIAPFSQAVKTFSAHLNNSFAQILKNEHDPFAMLNAAICQEGAFIYVPPKLHSMPPLQIIQIIDNKDELSWMMPRLHIFIGNSSELHFVSTVEWLSGDKYFFNQVTELTLEDNAKASLIQCDLDSHDKEGWLFDAIRIQLKRSSNFKVVHLNDDSMTRRDYKATLMGEGAEVSLNGVWLLDGDKEAHTNVVIEHEAPHCRSMQLFKGVLINQAKSSFEGKILVRQKAQKTEAYQLNNNLVLSDEAKAYSKPNLEIFADDVKATHGATVGQLDQEQMFYLKTRGFSDHEARNLLINGFCQEVVDLLFLPSLQEKACSSIYRYINPA